MSIGLIGRKVGVTQVFQGDGTMVAVSVLAIEPNTVTRLRTDDARRLHRRPARDRGVEEPEQARGRPAQGPAEGRQDSASSGSTRSTSFEVGQKIAIADLFADGDLVDVTGVSKGKGFAGHIKRHHFHRGPKSHGSDHHREPGSIGPGTTPGRVYKGLKMAGHMGDERATIKKLRVVRADSDKNLCSSRDRCPGPRGSLILVKKA